VAVADYDNDGKLDLFVTGYGGSALYHGLGNCKFEDVTEKAGVGGSGFMTGAAWGDYDRDGFVDLYVSRYSHLDMNNLPQFGSNKFCRFKGILVQCGPWGLEGESDFLYHNRGDGTFEDVSVSSGIAAKKGHGLGVAFADYDGDGHADIFVANDATNQFLFRNNGNGTFTEMAFDSGAALTNDGKMLSGMGVAFQDYDNDGLPDLLVTQLPHAPYVVFHNEGKGLFSAAELETGFGALSGLVSGWGVGLEDFDNDGWKDAFIVQGHVFDNVETYDSTLKYRDPPLLAMNRHGHFEKGSVGSTIPVAGRGSAFGDLNNDGWMDAITTSLRDRPKGYLNRGGTQHWLTIVLRGTKSNRDGFGALVKVNGQVRYATATGGYLSSNDKRLHFGLGSSERADVEVAWPSGVRQSLQDVTADKFLRIIEPSRK